MMDKLSALFNGFVGEIRGLKPIGRDEVKKLDSRDIRIEHNWAHRYAGKIGQDPRWGSKSGWSPKRVKEIHDLLLREGKKRELSWATDHKSPLFISHKIRK